MNSLYTDEVRVIVRTQPFPEGLAIEIAEYEGHLGFRLFRDNFETFDGVDKQYIAGLVGATIKRIRDVGIPCYLEVAKGNGAHLRNGS